MGLLDPLRPRQVAEAEHGHPGQMRLGRLSHSDELDSEDAVGTAGVVVEAGGGEVEVGSADHQHLVGFVGGIDLEQSEH